MYIQVKREIFTDNSTIGKLYIDNQFFCYTLEDKDRKLESGGRKIYGVTAIPRGIYRIKFRNSPKFGNNVPEICDVPGYSDILIHVGNEPKDTLGCILLGSSFSKDYIYNSKGTVNKFYSKIRSYIGDIEIEIK